MYFLEMISADSAYDAGPSKQDDALDECLSTTTPLVYWNDIAVRLEYLVLEVHVIVLIPFVVDIVVVPVVLFVVLRFAFALLLVVCVSVHRKRSRELLI